MAKDNLSSGDSTQTDDPNFSRSDAHDKETDPDKVATAEMSLKGILDALVGGGSGATHDEDSQHDDGDTGILGLSVFKDALGQLADSDGDYAPHLTDELGQTRVIVDGPDFDEVGASYGGSGSYESVTISDLSEIQDSNDWIDVRDRMRFSLAVNPNSEAMDVELEYKFSDGDTGQTQVETTNISAGTRTEITKDLDIGGFSHLRIRQKDNGGDGGGGIDARGVLK